MAASFSIRHQARKVSTLPAANRFNVSDEARRRTATTQATASKIAERPTAHRLTAAILPKIAIQAPPKPSAIRVIGSTQQRAAKKARNEPASPTLDKVFYVIGDDPGEVICVAGSLMHPVVATDARGLSMLSIGEASKRSGVHIETIRYYEREGILPPAERTASGRRCYDPQAIARLRFFVRRCRDLGFPMAEMRALLALTGEETPCAEATASRKPTATRSRTRSANCRRWSGR